MNRIRMKNGTFPISPTYKLFAIFVGIAVPSLAFGRAAFGVIVGLALIFLFFCKNGRDVFRDLFVLARKPIGILILLTFVAWLPNIYFSTFPVRSFEASARTLLFVGLAAAFYTFLNEDQRLVNLALRAFTVMTVISVTFTLLANSVLPEIYWMLRFEGWLSQPVNAKLKGFSALVVLIVPILGLAVYRLARPWKAVGLISSIMFLVVVWLNYNRSAVAGLAAISIVITFMYILYGETKRLALAAVGGASAIVVGIVVWLWVSRGIEAYAPTQEWLLPIWLVDYQRQTIWGRALEFGMSSPWFGIGSNTINLKPGANDIIEGTANLHVIPAHPHNWAIEVFAETGIIGLAALLGTIFVLAWMTFKRVRNTMNWGLVMSIAIMAGYWTSGLFNFSYWSAWWQMSFFISLALCYAFANHRSVQEGVLSGHPAMSKRGDL